MANASEYQQQPTSTRPVYEGARRKLVIAFDIGTTFSGASYSILDPGNVPTIHGVNAFPGQRTGPSTGSKIPSVLYYDQNGKVVAAGAEAVREGIEFEATENDWVKAEWFKLHLRASHTRDSGRVANEIPPLPPNKTVIEVFGDFIRYMMDCTVAYIRDTHPNSAQLWECLKGNIAFVFSHPNGWDDYEQDQMHQAAAHSGIIGNPNISEVMFVTEGDSSTNFAIERGVIKETDLRARDGVVLVDAGGGTIDVSAYPYDRADDERPRGPLPLKEPSIPKSYFQGSIFVTVRAMEYLRGMLANSAYLMDIEHIARCFDESAKVRFRDATVAQYIKFGSAKDNDAAVNIRFGQLKLPGQTVAEFFQPSIDCIVDAVKEQIKTEPDRYKKVLLVGGFSGSQWLFNQVRDQLSQCGLNVLRVEHYTNKAVSNASVSTFLEDQLRFRLTTIAFGVELSIQYNPKNPEHVARHHLAAHAADGTLRLSSFIVLVKKSAEVSLGTHNFQQDLVLPTVDRNQANTPNTQKLELLCYRGDNPSPQWIDSEADKYSKLCTVYGDISRAPVSLSTSLETGETCYAFNHQITLSFNDNELSAFFSWKSAETGEWEEGPRTIICHPFDLFPSVGHHETQGAGNPLLPDPTPNQESAQDVAQGQVKEKIQVEVLEQVEGKVQEEAKEMIRMPEDSSKAHGVDPKPRHCRTCTCEEEN